jgi:hypothetical protein
MGSMDECNDLCSSFSDCAMFSVDEHSGSYDCFLWKGEAMYQCVLGGPEPSFAYGNMYKQLPDTSTPEDHCTHKPEFNTNYGIVEKC